MVESLLVEEEAGVEVQPGLLPLHVEVEGEGDAEVAVVDLEHVAYVDLDQDLVGPGQRVEQFMKSTFERPSFSVLKLIAMLK